MFSAINQTMPIIGVDCIKEEPECDPLQLTPQSLVEQCFIKSEPDILSQLTESDETSSNIEIKEEDFGSTDVEKYNGSNLDFSSNQLKIHPTSDERRCDKATIEECGSILFVISKESFQKQYSAIDTNVNFSCDMCQFTSTLEEEISVHKASHYVKKCLLCEYCAFKTDRKDHLKRHILIHTGEKNFSCVICPYKTTEKSKLSRHVKIHSQERPFPCAFCPYRTIDKARLNKHIKAHSVVKPFQCKFCPFSTKQGHNMKRHNFVHTEEKPFPCELCSYRAIDRSKLNRHLKIHK